METTACSQESGLWLASLRSLSFHQSDATSCISFHPFDLPGDLVANDSAVPPRTPRRRFLLHERAVQGAGPEQIRQALWRVGWPQWSLRVVPSGEIFGGAFRLLEFDQHRPLVYVDGHFVGLFLESADDVLASYLSSHEISPFAR
ncbi:Scr1 family TA system antitoxin-like transcriptional regulator [Kibdelosporangium philippinense]